MLKREILQKIFDGIQDGISVLDKDMNIIHVNKAMEKWYRHVLPISGKKCFQAYHGRSEPCTVCPVIRAMEKGTLQMDVVPFTSPKGKTGWFELFAFPLRDDKGNITEVVEQARDITERKRLEETILQSEKLKAMGVMTSGIAHEFNNILAIILGNLSLVETSYKDHRELIDSFRIMRKAISDGSGIVRRMYEFTRTKEDPSTLIPTDMRDLIKHAIDFTMPKWKNMAQAGGITYIMDKEGTKKVPGVMVNPLELREVLVNIINNALDAMPNGGRISFRTWGNKDTVFVSVSDAGVGMTEAVRKQIFDPFFTTRSPQGSGLGMSVVYSIIKRYSGAIDIRSELGKGSTITISLPITTKTLQPELSIKPKQKKKVKNLHILVVDDMEEICMILDTLLTQEGHNVKSVNSSKEAIKILKTESFDLVLSDLVMPDVSGYDVIRFLDKLDKKPKVGLITGWDENLENLEKEGIKVDFLAMKPFNFTELSESINDAFNT